MNRRLFLLNGSLAGAALTTLSLAQCTSNSAPTGQPTTDATAAGPAAAPDAFPLLEATVADLQQHMQAGRHTSRALCELYLQRVEAVNAKGPTLRAVIETNPDALKLADALDAERKAGKVRGPLHGIPVLIKDNIDTGDQMQTTAGSLALAGHRAKQDAFIVKQLRAAGAVVLGKTNLSEWANFRSTRATSGWSSRGGQTKNPYILDRTPSGSSAGSGSAAAASLCAVAIGTETDGSVVSPSSVNGLVGLKPTVGLLSRMGIIPISATQDTAGPMARTVRDAALLLAALTGEDPADAVTRGSAAHAAPDYTKFLDTNALKGKRLGVEKSHLTGTSDAVALLQKALAVLKAQGATIVEINVAKPVAALGDAEFQVLLYEFKDGVNKYLAGTNAGVKTLADVIAFDKANAAKAMPFFQQETLEAAEKTEGLGSAKYQAALARSQGGTRKILDKILHDNQLAAIIGITTGPAGCIDLVNGDYSSGLDFSSPAAMAGYPHLTVPMGQAQHLPVGLSLVGPAWSEGLLLGLGYAYEQATKLRKAPEMRGPLVG
ncbi:amidase [Hymenobacter sp. BRD67]|uniref:amidase n=1 Tax=Hymenobacter sp. BRD67 TaxID=2675877 RepID=UPI0015652D8B|nr:amidase [Hymenobacter sp. BRD67]QKG51286.1 amidase [Hymenobacter sp. BRD67]